MSSATTAAMTVPTTKANRRLHQQALSLFCITLLITMIRGLVRADMPFIGPHAFVSADVATMARTFAQQGIFALQCAPVNNSPPISGNDVYTHWPPLLPMLLSLWFRVFGSSERSGHLFMLLVLVVTAVLLYRLGRFWFGAAGGALAGYFWLTLPVVVQFGDLISQQALMVLFSVAALFAFSTGRLLLGYALLLLSVLTSWETMLLLPGLWWVAFRRPAWRHVAAYATATATIGVAAVAALYIWKSPSLTLDLLQTAKYYLGMSDVYSRMLPHDRQALSLSQQIIQILWNHLWMLGALGLAAVIQLFVTRPKAIFALVLPLATPWLLWTLTMRTHVAIHHFELLIAAPLTAVALAWLATVTPENATKVAILPAAAALQLLLLPHPPPLALGYYTPERLMRFGLQIKAATEPGSITMAPLVSAVPLYYSERHIVRDVVDDATAAKLLPALNNTFPHTTIYLALPPHLAQEFPRTSKQTPVFQSSDVLIYKLP